MTNKWILPIVCVIVGLIVGALLFSLFRKNPEPPSALQGEQEIRMKQYVSDSIKFTRIISALKAEKNRLDTELLQKEANLKSLWKQLYEAENNRISNLTPDSTVLYFSDFTGSPPGN